ncbi:hypothetical protein Tco_1099145, partial [Tanacetum coccineum]
DQEDNQGNDDEEPKGKVASKHDWFTKPKRHQEPTDPDWNDRKTPQQGPTQSWLITLASSTEKPSKTFDELMSTPIDFPTYIMNGLKINLTQETLLGPAFRLLKGARSNYAELEYDFEECYKALSEKLYWNNPEGGDYLFDLTKPQPLVIIEWVKNIEDMVPNIWSLVKVAYDKHALWDISHWRDQRKSFYGYVRGLESRHDVYSTKHILAVTQVEVMRKHGYGYLKEIVSRLTNHSGDDVFDFAIALRMFTRSLVIQKRVKNLQLGVESYQKKINITKPETTKPGIRKRDPYTPYQDPQGFIYVDNKGRNKLIQNWRDLLRDIPLDSVEVFRSILTDSKIHIKMDMEQQSVKVKELQERCIIKAFKLSYQEKYEHVGPKSQDHKMARLPDDVKRLCLVDDLKKFKIIFISSQRYKSKPKVKDYYNISQVKD